MRRFEHETNLKAYILLDCSGSMGFRTGTISKLEYGRINLTELVFALRSK